MKQLRTDRQTLNDLGVMESTYGEKTLFSLFDMTESDGGKRCLEDWATHPISDWQMLHERQEAIRCPDFPEIRICREELDFIEFYLSQGDIRQGLLIWNLFYHVLSGCSEVLPNAISFREEQSCLKMFCWN